MRQLQYSKRHVFTLVLLFLLGFSWGQNNTETLLLKDQKSDFWEKVHFGGGIGLNFSNGYSYVAVSPNALYAFNDKFGLGVGLNVNYSKRKNYSEATVFGGSIISVFKPIEMLQLSAEFEENNIAYKNTITNVKSNYWQPALFLGVGYAIGKFGAIGVRYDVLFNDEKSPYGTAMLPFVSIYF